MWSLVPIFAFHKFTRFGPRFTLLADACRPYAMFAGRDYANHEDWAAIASHCMSKVMSNDT